MYHRSMDATIPTRLQRALSAISALDEAQFDMLLSVFKTEQPSLNTSALVSRIAQELEIPQNTAATIVSALTSNYSAKVRSGGSASVLAEVNVREFDRSRGETKRLSEEERDSLRNRLTQLLSIESFDATAKVSDIAYDHERIIQSTRVLTDIRPAFLAEPPEPPAAAVLVHMLKISYQEADEEKEFFVALDSSDVDDLIKTLEHAKAKAQSLKAVLAKAELRHIDVE
jgi:hypothetical protein